jgi:hypothetical protein
MAIDCLNISFTCEDEKKPKKTVQELKMAKTVKNVPKINEKQRKFRKSK